MVEEWTPKQVKEAVDRGENLTLLDVRRPDEIKICQLPGSLHIPQAEIHKRYEELDQYHPIIIYCRSGQRSAQVCSFLQQKGYTNVYNLAGGILRWADDVDGTVQKY